MFFNFMQVKQAIIENSSGANSGSVVQIKATSLNCKTSNTTYQTSQTQPVTLAFLPTNIDFSLQTNLLLKHTSSQSWSQSGGGSVGGTTEPSIKYQLVPGSATNIQNLYLQQRQTRHSKLKLPPFVINNKQLIGYLQMYNL